MLVVFPAMHISDSALCPAMHVSDQRPDGAGLHCRTTSRPGQLRSANTKPSRSTTSPGVTSIGQANIGPSVTNV